MYASNKDVQCLQFECIAVDCVGTPSAQSDWSILRSGRRMKEGRREIRLKRTREREREIIEGMKEKEYVKRNMSGHND